MRLSLLIALVLLPALALARPKVAIAPLDGDDGGKVAAVVEKEAGEHAKVTGHDEVGRALDAIGASDARSTKTLKKLRVKLEVDAIVHGKVERDGSKKRLALTVSGRGKKASSFELVFKSSSSKAFRKELREELGKRIAAATDGDARDDDDDDEPKKKLTDDDEPRKKKLADDDDVRKKKLADDDDARKKKLADDEGRTKRTTEDDHPKRRVADDGETRTRKRSDDDDDRGGRKKHRRHRDEPDEPLPHHPVTQPQLWVDVGGAGLRRTLTYTATKAPPPPVGTGSFSGQLEAEAYPDALKGLGLFGSFGKTVGLSIAVPGTTVSAPIDEGHYAIGLRYRVLFGQSAIAFGLGYWRQFYIADRSTLGMATLDMPDVDYTAVAPGIAGRFAVTPTAGVFATLEVPLMMSTGGITSANGFGKASALAVAFAGGVDVALAPHYGLRFAAVVNQVSFTFAAAPGSMADTRGVAAATDRTMGIAATFALLY